VLRPLRGRGRRLMKRRGSRSPSRLAALHGPGIAVAPAGQGRLRVPVAAAFPLAEAASVAAHELSVTDQHFGPM